jgi:hypothetical protein
MSQEAVMVHEMTWAELLDEPPSVEIRSPSIPPSSSNNVRAKRSRYPVGSLLRLEANRGV